MATTPTPPYRLLARRIHVQVPLHLRVAMLRHHQDREDALRACLSSILDLDHGGYQLVWEFCRLQLRSTRMANTDRVVVDMSVDSPSTLPYDDLQELWQRIQSENGLDMATLRGFYNGEVWLRLPGPGGTSQTIELRPDQVPVGSSS